MVRDKRICECADVSGEFEIKISLDVIVHSTIKPNKKCSFNDDQTNLMPQLEFTFRRPGRAHEIINNLATMISLKIYFDRDVYSWLSCFRVASDEWTYLFRNV